MLKKVIKFTNFNGQEMEEEHYFHLSKADLVEMELSHEGGLSKHLERVVESEDGKQIIETFKDLIKKSYGKKSQDGRQFVRNDELWESFVSSEAYTTLFMELVTNAQSAADFVNGLLPKGLEQDVDKIQAERSQDKPAVPKPLEAPRGVRGGDGTPQRVLTMQEATDLPSEELQRLLASGEARIGSSEG